MTRSVAQLQEFYAMLLPFGSSVLPFRTIISAGTKECKWFIAVSHEGFTFAGLYHWSQIFAWFSHFKTSHCSIKMFSFLHVEQPDLSRVLASLADYPRGRAGGLLFLSPFPQSELEAENAHWFLDCDLSTIEASISAYKTINSAEWITRTRETLVGMTFRCCLYLSASCTYLLHWLLTYDGHNTMPWRMMNMQSCLRVNQTIGLLRLYCLLEQSAPPQRPRYGTSLCPSEKL